VSNGSGAAVAGLLIGIILAAEAAGWGDDDGDGLALESGDSGGGEDTTTSEPAVPTSVDGGATARPNPGPDDTEVITVTDRSGRTVALAVPPAAGLDIAAPNEPSAPALLTAATSSGVVAPPAIGAWMMGYLMPTLEVKRVGNLLTGGPR